MGWQGWRIILAPLLLSSTASWFSPFNLLWPGETRVPLDSLFPNPFFYTRKEHQSCLSLGDKRSNWSTKKVVVIYLVKWIKKPSTSCKFSWANQILWGGSRKGPSIKRTVGRAHSLEIQWTWMWLNPSSNSYQGYFSPLNPITHLWR